MTTPGRAPGPGEDGTQTSPGPGVASIPGFEEAARFPNRLVLYIYIYIYIYIGYRLAVLCVCVGECVRVHAVNKSGTDKSH